LKIDRVIGWRSWIITWRLLGLSMPLTIICLALLAHWILGLGAATALLLAAALAPTDPVLASDIQVGPPGSGEEDETRFALTSEAGLNDGLAFPFVHAAIAIAVASQTGEPWAWRWFSASVLWKLGAGIAVGYVVGRALGWLLFHMPNRARLSRTGDGFVALGITCLAYGLTEMAHGYGFLAVFVAALALRSAERHNEYHEKLHDFAEQLERLLMMALLVMFGAALTDGDLFRALTWQAVAFGLVAVFLVRPLSGWVALAGAHCPSTERAVISFYGIRGLGSVYYLAYGLQKGGFEAPDLLWSTMAFIVLVSILLHGATVTPIMRYLDRRRESGITGRETKALESATARQ
jgi:NhaP-type Na+/H+ or K+/H+ antiporter